MQFAQGGDAAPFNMAMLFYMELHKVREKKTEAMLKNDFYLSYDCMHELLSLAYFKFNKDERKKISKLLDEAKKSINTPEEKKDMYKNLTNAKQKLREADRQLMVTMNKYRMIFPQIEYPGGLDNLRKKYGLEEKKGEKKAK